MRLLCLFQKLGDGDDSISFAPHLGENLFQHWNGPAPPVMANDDSSRSQHAQDVISIDAPIRYLRVVRIDAAKNEPVVQSGKHIAHALAEETRAGPEISGRLQLHVNGSICLVDQIFHGLDLLDEGGIGQRPGRLIVHGVVAEFMAGAYKISQGLLAAWNLAADDKEGGRGIVGFQHAHDVGCVLGRTVINGESDNLGVGRHTPQHIGPSQLQMPDYEIGGLVDKVQRSDQDACQAQEKNHGRDSRSSRAPA